MAYVEVTRQGKLIKRQRVDDNKARKGLRIRLGSQGEVHLALGQHTTLGDLEVELVSEAVSKGGVSAGLPLAFSQNGIHTIAEEQSSGPEVVDFPRVEGYQVTGWLGEGGMGTVWRAVQLGTQREVALKLLGTSWFTSTKAKARFEREVALSAKLTHPNIARIYDSGLHRGMYYYAMELVEGVHLDRYVRDQNLNQDQILSLMKKTCEAVESAHVSGVVHRDLKPSNILVTPDGEPHVLDFGLAKAKEPQQGDLALSIDGEITGTPAYMSPEQAAGKTDAIDERTDVYSLGVILYQLVTGRMPHDMSGSRLDVLKRIAEQDPIRPRQASREISHGLESVLLKALSREPRERYAAAGELSLDIERYLAGDTLAAGGLDLRIRFRKWMVPPPSRLMAILLVGAIAAVAAVTIRIYVVRLIDKSSDLGSIRPKTARVRMQNVQQLQPPWSRPAQRGDGFVQGDPPRSGLNNRGGLVRGVPGAIPGTPAYGRQDETRSGAGYQPPDSQEIAAGGLINQVKTAVVMSNWSEASSVLNILKDKYASTKAVRTNAHQIILWEQQIARAQPQPQRTRSR